MNDWISLPNKLNLDANNMFKHVQTHWQVYVTKIVYVYDQAFKVGGVGNVISTLYIGL